MSPLSSVTSDDEVEKLMTKSTENNTGARPKSDLEHSEFSYTDEWIPKLSPSPKPLRKGKNSSKREENLFSLKQFLKNDNPANHQFAGARPKVYEPPSRTQENCKSHETGKYSRNPTELPDFVQDHLVIEQCYLGDEDPSNINNVEVPYLPDFAISSVEQRRSKYHNDQWNNIGDSSFNSNDHLNSKNLPHSNSSDLPKLYVINNKIADVSESLESDLTSDTTTNHLPEGIPSTTKRLPDFLSDAPICTRGTPLSNRPDSTKTNESWLSENERLRNELQIVRRQANERLSRIETLENELTTKRQLDHTENLNLVIEQVEDNLKRSTKRAINAETMVATLKKEVDSLSIEIMMLRTENRELRAAIGLENSCKNFNNPDIRVRRLADDLRHAATTAESSLKQLMSGVDNLKVLASALENMDKIEDRTKDFLPDFDEDNAAGPAL